MPSPPRFFRDSSPAGAPGRTRSQFTYRHLSQLASSSTTCPLRVIAHIDLDCFYAQVEMVRLGVSEDKPLAVQQWQGLIAVNYPARVFGIGRHCTVTEAKKLCPDLIAQHVATWRFGDDKWFYHSDAAEHIATDKVSLDPYRLESRKIFATIKEQLPSHLQAVEKAGIDEVFLDLSAHVHAILLERFPELAGPPPYNDPTEQLPMPSTTALDWQADALVDVNENAELVDPDWDDVAMLIGSEIVRDVRQAIREKLHYTCSAGIAKNKLLSKLGSAHKKPNQQTVIPNRAIQHFLSGFKFTKMRNLGGKLGEEVSRVFETDQVSDLLSITVEQFKLKLGDDTGTWVYNTIRGIDTSEVNARTQIKSMLSAKSFRPSVTTVEQATKWLRIFAADIFSRLVEEGVLENKRRPKTINLHFRHGGQTRSRQGPIPQGRPLEEETLFELAKSLLSQIVQEGDVWPCSNLSLSIGGFEEGITGNMGIAAFLVKGEEAQALRSDARSPVAEDDGRPAEKRRRTDDGGIQRFFMKKETSSDQASEAPELGSQHTRARNGTGDSSGSSARDVTSGVIVNPKGSRIDESDDGGRNREDTLALWLRCPRCDAGFEDPDALQSHEDWHFAKDLQEEERGSRTLADRPAPASSTRTGASRNASAPPKRPGRPKKTERGQSRLNFG